MTIDTVTVNVEAAILEVLNTCPASPFGGRIFPLTRGNCDTYPAATYRRVSTQPYATQDSAGKLAWARFQIDIYAKTYADVVAASNHVLGCLRGFNGIAAGCRFSALLITMADSFNGDVGIYRMRHDYRITYNEKLIT